MRSYGVLVGGMAWLAAACGSSAAKPTVQAPKPTAPPVKSVAEVKTSRATQTQWPATTSDIPHACTGPDGVCYPPAQFVHALCKKKYAGVALAMFEKSEPWRHVYIKVKAVAPVNSLGGPSAFASLEFLEEVLILRAREIKQRQMITDIPNSYDVLRLDGTCATLAEDEFMTKKPYVPPRYAPLIWETIDAPIRKVLTLDSKVDQAALAQSTACRGSYLAGGGEPCKAATQQLTRAIVAALGAGVELPPPSNLPTWSVAERSPKPNSRGCPVNHTC